VTSAAAHDKKFFNTFMLVLGVLIAIALVLYLLARMIASNTQERQVQADPQVRAALLDRIAPVAKVAIAGQDNSALAAAQQEKAPAADLPGKDVFDQACQACHGLGVAGAPKVGDKAAWSTRIAQGNATLHKHAIEGFQGKAGFMPPKGGRVDMTDQSIMNAVDYMIAQSK
jgi:cytochrome c5